MRPTNQSREVGDFLGEELTAIQRWLADNGLKAVTAWIEPRDGVLTVRWSSENDKGVPDWRGFLEQAKALRAPFVAMMVQRLTQEEWEDERELALGNARERGEPAETPLRLGECRAHIGEVGAIELKHLAPEYPGVVFALSIFTTWFDLFYGSGEKGAEGEAGPKSRELSKAEVQELAAKVARSPEYERAAGYRQQEETARRLLPAEATEDEHEFYRVMRAAADIFEGEILPKLQKSADVQELAMKLADDPRFQRASNQQARRYAAEQILPQEVVGHGTKLQLVLERAKVIYDVDLRKGKRSSH